MDKKKMLGTFFAFKLGTVVKIKKEKRSLIPPFGMKPSIKLVVQERLLVEYLEATKPRRIMYACTDQITGKTDLYPEMALVKWTENRKTLIVSR